MLAVTVPPLVAEMAVVLLAAAAISYLCTRIGLVPIVGFVLAFRTKSNTNSGDKK